MSDPTEIEKLNFYLIPGMGADHRLYSHFDLQYGDIHHLDWIPHAASKNLTDYAAIMSERVQTNNNIIIGSSMGGMVAVEMSRLIKPLSTILVSAPSGRHEFPPVLKFFEKLRLHKVLSPKQVMQISNLADTFMSFKTKEDRDLFYEMLSKNGPEFLHFSVGAILGWKNRIPPEGQFLQILGTGDRLFRKSRIPEAIMIEGSGHFTAFEKGKEVSDIINQYILEKILPGMKRPE